MYDDILDTAEKLFMTQGYLATSTRQITDLLGVSQPTIYYHFKHKEDIYYHVMLRLSLDVEQKLKKIEHESTMDLEDTLLLMINYLTHEHPINFFLMMHDIKYNLSEDMSQKLYQLFSTSYKTPFINLFKKEQSRLSESINIDFTVGQLFILMTAYLGQEDEGTLPKSIHLFLNGVYA
ncbi:TetR/AcrR family transcriptional regulator [Vagococcus vulneris]|uniref:TetR family transcriptional regulator n=1 Tax=Vagococcus vulneris TaxID=1977869 RepID=A0A429ZYD0_9ENTE|nr:TetR/AcrR family transcriptional regulator [Vagococcus vulneris]RST98951.1 TetR family transcriptional regulator [Vagococcus vulneris]